MQLYNQSPLRFTGEGKLKGTGSVTKFDETALESFYNHISEANGVPVKQVCSELEELFGRLRSKTDTDNFIMGKNPWKKLSDEICPVMRFLKTNKMTDGVVSFPLNSEIPDCWYWPDTSRDPIGIEVTIALGTARMKQAKELVDNRCAYGFIGSSDKALKNKFNEPRLRSRIISAPDGIISATKNGVSSCLSKKNRPLYGGMILIIQAKLGSLPEKMWKRWEVMVQDLKAEASPLPFSEIYLIGNSDTRPQSYKLK